MKVVDSGQADEMAPPAGTAIVRPLQYVRAVRARYLQRFTDPAQVARSRSARAWVWSLGETAVAPVTDQVTAVPPDLSAIEAEIAVADERRLRGDGENRADAAAAVLRWLIGTDDHVPVRCANPGELVGGFGDVVRSRTHIADMARLAAQARRDTAVHIRDTSTNISDSERRCYDADYLHGVTATLVWVGGQSTRAPITGIVLCEAATMTLKRERVYAEDIIEQGDWWPGTDGFSPSYGQGVKATISWILGDSTLLPFGRSHQG